MSAFGRLLLVSTALAPVLLVYGAAIFFEHRARAISLSVVAAIFVPMCHALLAYIRRHGSSEETTIEEVSGKDTDILSFLVAYMLPVALAEKIQVNPLALFTFLGLMGLVLFRADIYHVNPLMGILGYHFYEVKSQSGATYLVVTRRREPLLPGALAFVRLSRTLLLEREA